MQQSPQYRLHSSLPYTMMMMSRNLQTTPIIGYYEYLSPIRHRVNVAPDEGRDNEEAMTQSTTTTSIPNATLMGNGNRAAASNTTHIDDVSNHSSKPNSKDVAKWSSSDVQHWIKHQCKKFDLKKATSERFELNGQGLILLTKHDFLRRSPDGGEILYYALQRLINPNKENSTRLDQSLVRNGSTRRCRIVELDPDAEEQDDGVTDSSTPKPIVEEPDDPPAIRKSRSDTSYDSYHHQQQQYPHVFLFHHLQMRNPVVTMPAGAAAAYFHQQQTPFPNAFMYAQPHPHHAHPHMHQQQFFHPYPHFIHQYHPMMSARGILIEEIDNELASNLAGDVTSIDGATVPPQESLYMVTVNGQRYVMNEAQVRQFVTEVHQHQTIHEHQQRQQHYFQQQQQFQHLHQHQQQHFQQQQPPPQNHHQQQQQQQQSYPPQDNGFYTA